jgi:mannonate dehydratase
MKISVWNDNDLSDRYLKQVTQLGADCIDFGSGAWFPGTKEQGYPDLDAVIKTRKKIQSYGLDINRVTLPDISEDFMKSRPEGDKDYENTCQALRVFAEAGCPLARQRFVGDTFPQMMARSISKHRGGYESRSESLARPAPEYPSLEELDAWWERFRAIYDGLVPIADETGIQLTVHPSDTPNQDTPFGGIGFHRVIDAYPSRNVGYLYCCGTRAESGGSAIVMDEINNYGRKGKIFMIHLRNVRGSLATAGGFEETLLDDGDMNMFKILRELKRVGFSGCVNPDHHPALEGDTGGITALGYSIGYIKALFAALAVV